MEAFPSHSFALMSFPTKNGLSGYEMNRWGRENKYTTIKPFFPGAVAKTSFLADSDFNGYDMPIPMYSSSNPGQVFPEIPISRQCDFGIFTKSYDPSKPAFSHVYGTTRFASGPSFQAFSCNYNTMLLPCTSGISPLATSPQFPRKEKKSEKEKVKEKKLICETCKKKCKRPSALRVHMRIHNGEKPFQCTHCPRSFSQSGNLTVHMRMHTGEKPFRCTICCKRFSQSNSLKVHTRMHTGEKPFKCGTCVKCFADRSSLAKHVRSHVDAETAKAQDL